MLHRPTRRDVNDWIFGDGDEASKYSRLVRQFFTIEELRTLAPALATLFEELGGGDDVPPLSPGRRSIESLCFGAPELGRL
ncbi:hypothetical protein BGZ52_000379, partial [Haplosporangium bisporale]